MEYHPLTACPDGFGQCSTVCGAYFARMRSPWHAQSALLLRECGCMRHKCKGSAISQPFPRVSIRNQRGTSPLVNSGSTPPTARATERLKIVEGSAKKRPQPRMFVSTSRDCGDGRRSKMCPKGVNRPEAVPTNTRSGRCLSTSICTCSRSGNIRSSASIRASHSDDVCSMAYCNAPWKPTGPNSNTFTRGSEKLLAISAVRSFEPFSSTQSSKSVYRCCRVLAMAWAIVASALCAGNTTVTGGQADILHPRTLVHRQNDD